MHVFDYRLGLVPSGGGWYLGGHGCRETTLTHCPRCRELERRVAELESLVRSLSDQVAKLSAALEEERRRGKRQAAPFSNGPARRRTEAAGSQVGQATWPACSSQCAAADRRDLRRTVASELPPLAAIDT